MAQRIPSQNWTELKRELLQRWKELTLRDLERTKRRTQSIVDLIEKKVGLAFEEASEKFAEIASRYHVYEEPKETNPTLTEEKKERILELSPKKPANRDRKPRDDFHA